MPRLTVVTYTLDAFAHDIAALKSSSVHTAMPVDRGLMSSIMHAMYYFGGDECESDDDEPSTMYS